MAHEDAVTEFLKAAEPILVEVKRRLGTGDLTPDVFQLPPSTKDATSLPRTAYTSIGVQTEVPVTFEPDFIESPISDCQLLTDCMTPAIDIEEVTLRKYTSNDRIGLTVSYSSGNGSGSGSDDTDTCTEVYISDIIPDSVAARDGRLRQGDQILQVNGRDVSTKDDTESLFAENKNAVTLLVSRCLFSVNTIFFVNVAQVFINSFLFAGR